MTDGNVLTVVVGDPVVVSGDVDDLTVAAQLVRELEALGVPAGDGLTLELGNLEIEDGPAMAVVVTALRTLHARVGRLVLSRPAQLLGHNLYRIGATVGPGGVQLRDVRQDEPFG